MATFQERPRGSHLHVATLRSREAIAPSVLQAVWTASLDADDPTSRPRDGWWSISDWASTIRSQTMNSEAVGFAAINVGNADSMAEGRLALIPGQRTPSAATSLVNAAIGLARAGGAEWLRLVIPRAATWAGDAARDSGFERIRGTHVMLRPAAAGAMQFPNVCAVDVRPLRPGEDAALLAALNRAWSGTWGFTPIPPSALVSDLQGQRAGMLVATDADDEHRIVATVHAIIDQDARNLDGGPYAWISNLTIDPDWRGRGLGRLMLARGVDSLLGRGAESVMLGVDGGNAAAVGLYESAGFEIVSTTDIWERSLRGFE